MSSLDWEMITVQSAASLALQIIWESRKLLKPEAVLFNSTRYYQLAIKLINLPCISYSFWYWLVSNILCIFEKVCYTLICKYFINRGYKPQWVAQLWVVFSCLFWWYSSILGWHTVVSEDKYVLPRSKQQQYGSNSAVSFTQSLKSVLY